jgi:type I restriction-modification system DNA methylase subunit
MNLAIRGIEHNLGREHADSFHNDPNADYILANPMFNQKDWGYPLSHAPWCAFQRGAGHRQRYRQPLV